MPTLHHKTEGSARWRSIPATDEEVEDKAHQLCEEALKDGKDAVVLIERAGDVVEMLVTHNDDPDADPWWSHRTVRPAPLAKAKLDPHGLELVDVIGNYEAVR